MSTTVARLRDRHILAIETDPTDRRRVRVTIHQAAEAGLFNARTARDVDGALRRAFPGLTEDGLLEVLGHLERLADLLQPAPSEPHGSATGGAEAPSAPRRRRPAGRLTRADAT